MPDTVTTAEYGVLLLCLVMFLSSYNLCYSLFDRTFHSDLDSERYIAFAVGLLGRELRKLRGAIAPNPGPI